MISRKAHFKKVKLPQEESISPTNIKKKHPIDKFSKTAGELINKLNREIERMRKRYSVDRMYSTRGKNEFKNHADVLSNRNKILLQKIVELTSQPSQLIDSTYEKLALLARGKSIAHDTRPADFLSKLDESEKDVMRQLKFTRRLLF